MPVKKSTKKSDDDNLEVEEVTNAELKRLITKLNKETENAIQIQESYVNTFNELKSFDKNAIDKMVDAIEIKKEEYDNTLQQLGREFDKKQYELHKAFERKEYDLNTEHEQKVAKLEQEYLKNKMNKVDDICNELNKKLVASDHYENMLNEISDLKATQDTLDQSLHKKYREKYEKELEYKLKTKELEHNVNSAELKSHVDQQKKEIQVLNNIITTLKNEITEQRALTKNVAQASAQGGITQNISK